MFSGGSVIELDNYIRLRRYGNSTASKTELKQDKGFKAEYEHIVHVISGNESNRTDIAMAFSAMRLLLKGKKD